MAAARRHWILRNWKLPAPCGDDEILNVHEALDKLAIQNKAEADLVKLRYFVGMTLEEAAAALGISARTADNYWAHAKHLALQRNRAGTD